MKTNLKPWFDMLSRCLTLPHLVDYLWLACALIFTRNHSFLLSFHRKTLIFTLISQENERKARMVNISLPGSRSTSSLSWTLAHLLAKLILVFHNCLRFTLCLERIYIIVVFDNCLRFNLCLERMYIIVVNQYGGL